MTCGCRPSADAVEPPHRLLILDEPTNNLDLGSVDQLVDALSAYRGALLIVSHDRTLLGRIGLDHRVELLPGGTLREVPTRDK